MEFEFSSSCDDNDGIDDNRTLKPASEPPFLILSNNACCAIFSLFKRYLLEFY